MRKNFLRVFLLAWPLILRAQNPAADLLNSHTKAPDSFSGKDQMHGIKFLDYQKFYLDWKLVTVRYRKDTHELRFTYANPTAWEALKNGSKDYPVGSVFAKIGFITDPDPAFTSSSVPSGAKRYQFMLRDKDKFPSTDGWGYALFNGKGKTFPGDPQKVSLACAACHKVVPDRGFVFSQAMSIEPFVVPQTDNPPANSTGEGRISFADLERNLLPLELKHWISADWKKVREIKGPLKKHLFEGTLDEVRPALIEESLRSNYPAVLISENSLEFSFVIPVKKSNDCPDKTVHINYGISFVNPMTSSNHNEKNLPKNKVFKIGHHCAKIY